MTYHGRRSLAVIYKQKNGELSSVQLELSKRKQSQHEIKNLNMARAIVFLFLIVAVVTISALPSCGVNERYNNCGSTCPPTCQVPSPPVCTLACLPGCECVQGFVRNSQNRCVLTQEC